MYLLVGLGNHGAQYRATRHNLGWDVVERLAEACQAGQAASRFHGYFAEARWQGEKLFFLWPTTYMNLSGESVRAVMQFFKLDVSRLFVFHDDLDLPLAKVRLKVGGGNAGHNGLKSIQQHLGTADFARIRLGIGRPVGKMEVSDFVLAPFTPPERELLGPLLTRVPEVLPAILARDFATAMNRLSLPPV
ncbi:MAG: aminoacyl-tRNA hydrolase [Magnetococcales bacterium]|nr:aminoacyl-tRNA hydrolase [Magnetococcales bacterium]